MTLMNATAYETAEEFGASGLYVADANVILGFVKVAQAMVCSGSSDAGGRSLTRSSLVGAERAEPDKAKVTLSEWPAALRQRTGGSGLPRGSLSSAPSSVRPRAFAAPASPATFPV